MRKANVKLKLISHITLSVTIVIVFFIGTWLQWQLTEKNSTMPSLQSDTIALAKFISGVDISQPSHILSHETAVLGQHIDDHRADVALSESEIATIIEEVTDAQPQEVSVLEPVLTNMEASFQTNKRVFIYHTHAREGWHHDETSDKNANSKDINITLLGEKL